MNFRATSALTCISFASVAALSGCVQFTPVKDMALDKPAYLAAHFNIESLPASVQGKLPSSGTHPLPFKVLAIAGSMVGHVGATTLQGNFQTTMTNAKDTGVVQQSVRAFIEWHSQRSYIQPFVPQPVHAEARDCGVFAKSGAASDSRAWR
jgi:hypothetical protein